ncbi:addiction module toxin RelE [Salmonella enterica]|nr:addiction module toxin RelE [Salmonella enterica]
MPDDAGAYQAYKLHLYSKSFELPQGGKRVNLQERTYVRDWSERAQPTQNQLEG